MDRTRKTTSVLAGLLLLSLIAGFNQTYAEPLPIVDLQFAKDGTLPMGQVLNKYTCENVLGGSWNPETCTVKNYAGNVSLTIPEEVTLKIIGTFENFGLIVIDKDATMSLVGWGISANGKMLNEGVIVNDGLIECKRCGFINGSAVINSGTINNDWKVSSNGEFYNMGTISNHGKSSEFNNRGNFYSCFGEVTGNPIGINPPVNIC